MKTKIITLFSVFIFGCISLSAKAEANHHVIVAIAPWLPPEQRDGIARLTANLLIESPAGAQITVFAAASMNTVIHVNVGDGSKRVRQQRLTSPIAMVVAAIRAATNSGVCFNVPVVLEQASREFRQMGTKTTVLLVGPALYQNEKEPAFDMTTAWPSDGHLSAGNKRSIFSTRERAHRLDGVAVMWLVTDMQALRNEGHREGVAHFWALFVGSQGGNLVSYSPDARNVFTRIFEEGSAPVMVAVPDPEDSEVIMRSRKIERVQRAPLTNASLNSVQGSIAPLRSPAVVVSLPAVASSATSRPVATDVAPIILARVLPATNALRAEVPMLERSVPETPVKESSAQRTPVLELPKARLSVPTPPSPKPPGFSLSTTLPTVAVGNTGIGITWDAGNDQPASVDLDLYVQPPDGGRELYCGCTNSIYGRYYRDIRSSLGNGSGNWRSEWEFVELYGDQLPEYVWVNLFYGQGPVRGKIRLQYHGRETTSTFVINAHEGSRGDGQSHRGGNPAWVRLDLIKPSENSADH